MTGQTFRKLTPQQRHVLLLAMYVRDALEDFHVEHLSDGQMKVLNQTIRQALFEGVALIESQDSQRDLILGYLVSEIPSYWEISRETAQASP